MTYSLSNPLGDKLTSPVGTHCILEIYGCPAILLNDAGYIQQSLREAAETAKSTLLDEVVHAFEPQGVTALTLLAESHISIHTWPEKGYAAIDVFTCGEHTEPEEACYHLIRKFQATEHTLQTVVRRPPVSVSTTPRLPSLTTH